MHHLIEINNISTGYNNKPVISNVNLTINKNDFIGIIGANGGGKTTLIKSILGLQPIWSGKIKFNIKQSEIGYLPQFHNFDKAFPITVKEVVLSGLLGQKKIFQQFSKNNKKQSDELMDKAGILNFKNTAIGNISGGQMQRALLCRALINKPKLIILDEPSTFVDTNFEEKMFSLLTELNKTTAIIMVSHDIGTISAHVKTIACVNKTLHYHNSNKITAEQLAHYNCPIQLITHGKVPHRVLSEH